MSDLFKRHRPKLGEDEERALWERVRTMPREAGAGSRAPAGRPWWAGLWAAPAVRFGAPALAVALVAVVWVVQQSPSPPARTAAPSQPAPFADSPAPDAALREESTPAPADESRATPAPQAPKGPAGSPGEAPQQAGEAIRDGAPAPSRITSVRGEGAGAATAGRSREEKANEVAAKPQFAPTPGGAGAGEKDAADRLDAGTRAKPSTMAPLASPEAPAGTTYGALKQTFRREDPRVGEIRAASPGGDAEERVARVRGDRFAAELLADVVRPPVAGPFDRLLATPFTGERVRVRRDAAGGWTLVEDADETGGALPPPRALEHRSGLAVELVRAVAAGDRAAVERVRVAAARAQAERADPGLAALLAWCDAARQALETR